MVESRRRPWAALRSILMLQRRPLGRKLRGPETLEVRRLLTRVAWPLEAGGNGHEYEPVAEFVTWHEARAVAAARGGHLVTLTSDAENQFVFGLINAPEYWHNVAPVWGPWIGYYQADTTLEPDGGWQWVTAEPWVYHDWRDGEPNDWSGEHHAHYNGDGFALDGRFAAWNDQPADTLLAYVIEYDGHADVRDFGAGDRLEPNDGFAISADLGIASEFKIHDLALADLVDRDWLHFRPTASGYARIRLEAPAGSRDLIAGIYDAQRQFLPSSNEEGVNTRLLSLSAGETYYVSARWLETRAGDHLAGPLPYRIVIETGLDLAAPDVPLSQAIPLTLGDQVVANTDGFLRRNEARELYAFDRGNRTHFDAAVVASKNLERTVFRLLDSAGRPLELQATLANGRLRLSGELPPGDRFYLEISHGDLPVDVFYDLEFALSRVLPTPTNTSPGAARELGPQQEFAFEAVQQANGGDGVFFTFTALAAGPHWLLADTDGAGQVGIELLGLDDPAANVAGNQVVELTLQAGQRYQVRLTSSAPALLSMRLRPATAAVPDQFEDNDSPQAPGLLEVVDLAVYEGLSLHYDPQPFQGRDRDFYRIAAPETGLLVVSLEEIEPIAGAAELILRRSDGASAPSPYSPVRTRVALPLAAGLEFTLEVVSKGPPVSVGYRLRLEVVPLPANEPGETPLDWGMLGSLPATHYALDYDGDADRYRFTAAESGKAIVSFRHDDARSDSANLRFSSATGRRTSFGRPRGDGWIDYPLTVLAGETIELVLESAPGGYQLAVATGPDDPWEPDNTLGEANKTYSSSPSEHLLGPGDEADLVTLFRTRGYAGTATLTFDQAQLGVELALVDRLGKVLAQGVVGTNQATVALPFSLVDEPAFLRVTRTQGQGRYIATLAQQNLFAAATSFDAAIDRGVLTEIPREVWSIARNQSRYFEFTAGAEGVLQASITGAGLELYGADRALLASVRSGQAVIAPVVAGQTYYLRLTSTANVSASLALAVRPPAENLSPETALDLGRVQLVRLAPLPLLAGQAAWCRFTAAITGSGRISTGGELYEWVEPQWRLLEPVFSNYQVREGATYALRLPAAEARLVSPSLRLDLGDELEPNDTPAAASYFGKVFATGGRASVLLGPNDVDHFAFYAGRAGIHRLTFDGAIPPGSSVQILNRNGAVLSVGADSVQAVLEQGNVYLLRITGAEVQQPTPYAFVWSWLGDRYEPNDLGTAAADWGQLAFLREAGLSLHEPTDIDWFSFVSPRSGQANLGLDHAGGELQFDVLDEGDAVVASSGPAAARLEVAWNAIAGARYRLHVFAAAGSDVAEYSVGVSLPTIPGDFDGSGMVDLADFGLLKAAFGRVDATRAAGDADGDGDVDLSDFGLLKANLGRS